LINKLRREERKQRKEEEKRKEKKLPSKKDASPPNSIKTAIELFMNLISINVNKIHIRFEDDYYSYK
jgi:hypothetical protein